MITGPAKGMGAAITKAFAAEGAKLALIGRDVAAIEPVAKEARRLGAEAIVVPCDLTDARQCEQAAAAANAAFGRIDILVNVAGGSGPVGKTGVETTPEEFDDIVTLNMNGCFHTMRAALPTMMAQRYGKIVNVGGTFGMRGRAGRMAYSASKWGLRGITKSFALEVGPYNINVNCVAPGMVDGPRFRDKVCADMAKRLGITRRAGRWSATPPTTRSSASPTTPMSPTPACSWRATSRARSPASTFRSMAAGPCCEEPTMTAADLVIRSGKVVRPDSVIDASIAIKDGRIIAVGDDAIMPQATETLDARGLHVLPGAIDDHVHFRDPGYPHKEDFASGTAAAAFGGVTTVFDMPNTIPPTGTPDILAAKLKMAAEKAHVDFGLYALLGEDTIEHVPELAKGAIGFKLYMGNTFGNDPVARRPARCWRRSRWWRRPASASRCMPRPTRSWSGARRGCAAPAASIRSRISPRGRRWSRSRR